MATYKFVLRDNSIAPATNATAAATASTKFNTRAIGLVMVPVALALMLLLFAISWAGESELKRRRKRNFAQRKQVLNKGWESYDQWRDHQVATTPEGDTDFDAPICAICLDEVQRDDEVWGLGCCHVYHRACLDPWIDQGNRTCPLCHRNLKEDSAGQRRGKRPTESLHLA
ncbi:hypothetical protein BDZ85DRAFT_45185 [Elsinoe ampelina]|uniref:RING-type domain-containing protein n=1 Tax=Elsinoe ampelina TaxID=302913 RepID=A0A6A6G1L8_9PEZI|nr:hypothetical protein BDZ85DRAFT_45185 [Elsinoe ampelina]